MVTVEKSTEELDLDGGLINILANAVTKILDFQNDDT